MGTVRLFHAPRDGWQLEDYVAACYQSAGFFVASTIEEPDVAEIDLLARDYRQSPPDTNLVDVKGGGWQMREAFGLLGLKTYMGADQATFITRTDVKAKSREKPYARLRKRGLRMVALDQSETYEIGLKDVVPGFRGEDKAFLLWRYSNWMMRVLVQSLSASKKLHRKRRGPVVALDYHREMNRKLFFEPDPLRQVSRLYSAYMNYSPLLSRYVHEIENANFEPVENYRFPTKYIVGKGYFDVEAVMFLEHRSRFLILRAAVDAVLTGAFESMEKRSPMRLTAFMPQSFQCGCRLLKEMDEPWAVPVIWQTYLWFLGGFQLKTDKEWERHYLAESANCDEETVKLAFDVYDTMFPNPNGWHRTRGDLTFLTLMPQSIKGVGAFSRLLLRGLDEYKDLTKEPYAESMMTDFHNCGHHLLEEGGRQYKLQQEPVDKVEPEESSE